MEISCPKHGSILVQNFKDQSYTCPYGCFFQSPADGVVDLLGKLEANQTSEHYSLQWGAEVDFASFYRENPNSLSSMTSKQMGWPALIEKIRIRAANENIRLLDAACGYGGLFMDLFASPIPEGLKYLGADIHHALPAIKRPEGVSADRAVFLRWDISQPLPTDNLFDFVICRAAIHHTPDPQETFRSLASRLAPSGTIAITVYAKKSPMREAVDDVLRETIVSMPPKEAFDLSKQFTFLGKDLQDSDGQINIRQDLPFLNIKVGVYGVQEFIYKYFMKCWFNPAFGDQYSDVVNFDWYHPPFAYRFNVDEINTWFNEQELVVTNMMSTDAQHYFEGCKRG